MRYARAGRLPAADHDRGDLITLDGGLLSVLGKTASQKQGHGLLRGRAIERHVRGPTMALVVVWRLIAQG